MIPQITEIGFPECATLTSATVTHNHMGEKSIAGSLKLDGTKAVSFKGEWSVLFRGEEYVCPAKGIQASKANDDVRSHIDVTFVHRAEYELKRCYMFSPAVTDSGVVTAEKYDASVNLPLKDVCEMFAQVLEYYYGNFFMIDVNPDLLVDVEPKEFELSYTYLWEVLGKINEVFECEWYIIPSRYINAQNIAQSGYIIRIGYELAPSDHVYEYGWEGGIQSIERQSEDDDVRNVIMGRGGEKNLPYRYFKRWDEKVGYINPATESFVGLTPEPLVVNAYSQGVCVIGVSDSFVLAEGKIATATNIHYHVSGESVDGSHLDMDEQFVLDGIQIIAEPMSGGKSYPIEEAPAGRYRLNFKANYENPTTHKANMYVDCSLDVITSDMPTSYNNYGGYAPDPDWCEELQFVSFDRLRGATFRSYIQGWNAQHGRKRVDRDDSFAPWAYDKGFTDEVFAPVEYVKDDASIADYGELTGRLDDNDDIYPTIQKVIRAGLGRVDEVVDVQPVTLDYNTESHIYETEIIKHTDVKGPTWYTIPAYTQNGKYTMPLSGNLTIPHGWKATIKDIRCKSYGHTNDSNQIDMTEQFPLTNPDIYAWNEGGTYRLEEAPEGTYQLDVRVNFANPSAYKALMWVVASVEIMLTETPKAWEGTFDIWVKNIWETAQLTTEGDESYSKRVWEPILGTSDGEEAKISFTTGDLSVSEDYNFSIVEFPAPDRTKSIDGVKSEWRIKLAMSNVELDSLGVYIPNKRRQAKAGDNFILTGVDMPHKYVEWAEERVDEAKIKELNRIKQPIPAYTIKLDRVRLHTQIGDEAYPLVSDIRVGAKLRLSDPRFIDGESIQTIATATYRFNEPSSSDDALLPEVDITLTNKAQSATGTIGAIQASIGGLEKEIEGVSQRAKSRATNYSNKALRADMAHDLDADSPVNDRFLSSVNDDRADGIITLGKGAIFGDGFGRIDALGNAELESLKVNALQALELVINRLSAIEGDQILTESDTIERVYEDMDGTWNLFLRRKYDGYFTAQAVGNIVKGIVNNLASGGTDYYTCWMKVNSVNTTANVINVSLYSDSDCPSGVNGIPCELMNIARWGHLTDKTRQSCLYLSSTEGRIVKLSGVNSPIITAENYGTTLGELPQWIKDKNLPIVEGQDYLYARGIVVQDIIRMDYQGKPKSEIVDRGAWVEGGKYYCDSRNPDTQLYETSDVWHYGCRWRCAKTGTAQEPKWNSTDWGMIEGNPDFSVTFADVDNVVDPDGFLIPLTIIARLYNRDVTADIADTDIVWTRYSEDDKGNKRPASDDAWATKRANAGYSITLTEKDIDFDGYTPKVVRFTATVTLRDGVGGDRTESANFEF